MTLTIRRAQSGDEAAIAQILSANRGDTSLFQQSPAQIREALASFHLALRDGLEVGTAALIERPSGAEILGVSVHPEHQGVGVGSALIEYLVVLAREKRVSRLWLGTAKPSYFARFGFRPMSRWRLPIPLLLHKLSLVFQQQFERWLPAIFGRHVFMALRPETNLGTAAADHPSR